MPSTTSSREAVALRLADLAVHRDASTVRVTRDGTASFSGKGGNSTAEEPDTGLAAALDGIAMESRDGAPVRVETPGHVRIQAVRVEADHDAYLVTLIPRSLFDFPIRGARAS